MMLPCHRQLLRQRYSVFWKPCHSPASKMLSDMTSPIAELADDADDTVPLPRASGHTSTRLSFISKTPHSHAPRALVEIIHQNSPVDLHSAGVRPATTRKHHHESESSRWHRTATRVTAQDAARNLLISSPQDLSIQLTAYSYLPTIKLLSKITV